MAIAASLALHAAVPASVEITKAVAPRFKDLIERVDSKIDKMKIERARKKLIAKARKDIKNGEFNLGKFILDAERIDAEEKGEEYKYEEALGKLEKKISEFRSIVEKGHKVQEAVPKVLSEFNYYGFPNGGTGDAIIENGGNCEAISHYIVSIVHGAGYEENVYFRVYSDHVAPVFVDEGVEYDLAAGNYAEMKGIKFAPEKLVDFYAVKHGLEEGEIISRDSLVASAKEHVEKKNEGSFPYPYTDEAHSGGSAPLFSEGGVKNFKPTKDKHNVDKNPYCRGLYFIAYELLNPVPFRVEHLNPSSMVVTPMEPDEQEEIDCAMQAIETKTKALEDASGEAGMIMYLAELSGWYLYVHRQLSIMGKTIPAKEAFEHRKEIEKKAKRIFEKIEDKDKFARELDGDNLWQLIFLGEDGVDFLFDLMRPPGTTYEMKVYHGLERSLMFLRIFPPTRERAEKKMKEWIHTSVLFYPYFYYYYNIDDYVDMPPPGHVKPKFPAYEYPPFCYFWSEGHADLWYDLGERYPTHGPYGADFGAITGVPEFQKLIKAVGEISEKYKCSDPWDGPYYCLDSNRCVAVDCVDDACKKIIILELGINALLLEMGFTASEYTAEVKFAKEFKEWLDDVEMKDSEANRVIKFMKEHIKKKYGF